jgi:hypothetical protein
MRIGAIGSQELKAESKKAAPELVAVMGRNMLSLW